MIKKANNSRHVLVSLLLASILLTACGGGGGGNNASNNLNNSGGNSGGGAVVTIDQFTTDIYTNDTYTDAEVSIDINGDSIVRTKLAILFKPSATQEQVEGLLARINATITASIAGARSVSIRIPDPGTVDNLEVIIADIESELFVEAVLKSIVVKESVIPDNVDPVTYSNALDWIRHHAAIGGTAAWNAKAAITNVPSIILMDFFGAGPIPLTDYLDANLSGNVADDDPNPSDHGYHVAGIMVADFGGPVTNPGVVTGIFPGNANLSIIDLKNGISDHDSDVLALMRAAAFGGTVVMNTSLGYDCQSSTTTNTCRERSRAMKAGIKWADMVRASGVENSLFHATAAGNRGAPAPDMRDTQTQFSYSTAATMTDMITDDGTLVPPLTNTVAVERVDGNGDPAKVTCLNDNSFVGGHLSAVGTNVISLDHLGMALPLSGTSMSTPQVAGLAAYLLAIDNSLTPQRIKEILIDTAQPVPTPGGAGCSDWSSPAPVVDAYAAVLALDGSDALQGTGSALVRLAILDVSSDGITLDDTGNGVFDEYDLMYFLQEIDIGNQEKSVGNAKVKYSRVDLNGDGFDGGTGNYKKKLNLDIDYPPTYTIVTQNIEGEVREFNENALTDEDILCYYAYSSLYTGDSTMRSNLLANRCKAPSRVAIYYEHTNQVSFPPALLTCNEIDNDAFDQRETFSLRPDYLFANPIPERPESHFWEPGDSNVDQTFLTRSSVRYATDPGGALANCDIPVNYNATSEMDSSITLNQAGDTINVDFSTTATSECLVWPGDDPNTDPWSCSSANTVSNFAADYDFKISAATSLNLNINMACTGPGLRYPDGTPAGLGPEIGYFIIRLDAAGSKIPTNRDPSKRIISSPQECYDGSPTVNIQQLIELDAPENPGDVERIIIVAFGKIGAYGNLGNQIGDPTPVLGSRSNTSTMQGTVKLIPAN